MENFSSQLSESWNNLYGKLGDWLNDFVLQLPNIILAIIVMLLALVLANVVKKSTRKLYWKIFKDQTLVGIFSNISAAVVILLMLFLTLGILGLDTALTSLLAGAGVAGLAIGLALQDPIVNLFSGIMMSVRKYYNVGDWVETNGFFGKIEDISLRSTVILTPLGQEVTIPNKDVIQSPLKNFTTSGERRVEVECGVSYGDNLRKVREVVIEAIKQYDSYDSDRPIDFFYTGYGNSSIDFKLRFWMETTRQPDFLQARSEAIMLIKEAFDQNDITIPFPIRTLDFDAKGGEKLNQMIHINGRSGQVESMDN